MSSNNYVRYEITMSDVAAGFSLFTLRNCPRLFIAIARSSLPISLFFFCKANFAGLIFPFPSFQTTPPTSWGHAPFYAFYFWLNPKVTKDQEPIKGDFAFGKPRTLFTATCFYRGSGRLLLILFVSGKLF